MFSDILLTVDFDRTLTGPDSKIPQRNLEAIEYFMANGGSFTINTGRSTATFWKYLDKLHVNAPFLLYNGSATYENGPLQELKTIDLDVWQTMEEMHRLFPDMNLEIQGTEVHYLIDPQPDMLRMYDKLGWRYKIATWGQDVGPFLKFAMFGKATRPEVASMYEGSAQELRRFDEAEALIKEMYKGKVEVFRASPKIIDVHAKGVSKNAAARALQEKLGKKILVCVGDSWNDIPMLEGADYSYCPKDAELGDRYENVCECGMGAVADVIYEKIPEILKKHLDTMQ